jgi:hypothetical protein
MDAKKKANKHADIINYGILFQSAIVPQWDGDNNSQQILYIVSLNVTGNRFMISELQVGNCTGCTQISLDCINHKIEIFTRNGS